MDIKIIIDLAMKADSIQLYWKGVYTTPMTNEEAVELAYLGFTPRQRFELFPDYKLAAMIAVERLSFWQANRNAQAA